MIKLLALDLDGTLLDSAGNVPQANREAVRAAEDAGVLVTIATGRRFRDARPVGIEMEFNAPLISHNGALLKYARSLETVASSILSLETGREILRVGKEFGGNALISTDPHGKGTMLYDRVSEDNVPLQKYLQWSELLHGDEADHAVMHVDDLHAAIAEHEVIHMSFSGRCAAMKEMQQYLATELGDAVKILATVYAKRDFTLLDILPPDASKGTGVEKLAIVNHLTPDEVMVIGDNFNDLDMLEYAGTPVVMGNADPGLLERPEFYKTLTNNEGGVAAAISRFILDQEN